jgi:hypothetical protein
MSVSKSEYLRGYSLQNVFDNAFMFDNGGWKKCLFALSIYFYSLATRGVRRYGITNCISESRMYNVGS